MLKPVKLQKVRIIGVQSVKGRALALLRASGVMHLINIDLHKAGLLDGKPLEDYEYISEQLIRIRAFIGALSPCVVKPEKIEGDIIEQAKAIQIRPILIALKDEEERLSKAVGELKDTLRQIERFSGFDIDFNALPQELNYKIIVVPSKRLNEVENKLKRGERSFWFAAPDIKGKGPEHTIVLFATPKDTDYSYLVNDFESPAWPKVRGTPEQAMLMIKHEIALVAEQQKALERKKLELSLKYYPILSRLEEALTLRADLSRVASASGTTKECFYMEGWAKPSDAYHVRDEFARVFGNEVYIKLIAHEEHHGHGMPTMLENPKVAGPFEYLVNFLSVPQASEIDPSFIAFFTIPLMYALIVGDAGYAVISMFLSYFMMSKSKPGSMLNNFAKIWMVGAFYSLIFGIAFDEYFGYTHKQILGYSLYTGVLHRVTQMSTLLTMTILIGWVHVLCGFILGAINAWEHSKKHAAAKLSWIPIQIGGTFAVMHFLLNAADATAGFAGAGVFAFGVAVLLWAEGPIGVVEIPGLASNIMSYARIAAVGVAGVVLAEIINTLVSPNPKLLSTPEGTVLFIFISILYVLLHIVNTVIAMVEGLIHGARLNVVEFFGKFYTGGGKAFAPFREERQYTVADENDILGPA